MSVSRRHFIQSSTIVSATIATTGVASFPIAEAAQPAHLKELKRFAFSDRGIEVMQLANQESQFFTQEYVGSEHLLLAIANEAEAETANATWLDGLGLTHDDLRCVTSHLIPNGKQHLLMGKLPQSGNMKAILNKAASIARELGDDLIEPEHILLGMIETLNTKACDVLNEMWFERGACRQVAMASLQARKLLSSNS